MKNEKMKYRMMAVVVTLSVLLSYVAVFVVDSYASRIDDMPSDYVYVATFHESNGNAWQYYVDRQYFDLTKNCFCKRSDGTADFLGVTISNAVMKHTAPDIYYETVGNMAENWCPWYFDGSSLYVFSDLNKAREYLAGTLSEDDLKKYAINYDEIQESSAIYDASVPAPDKLYINSLSSSAVNSVWQYTDTTIDLSNVTYKVEVENFYMSSSLFNSIVKGYTGKNGESSWKFNGTIDACNRLRGMSTVETYLSAPTQLLADQVLVSGEVMTDSGVMHATNVYICKPTDYSGQFASSQNAFFTGVSNSHWVEYCGSQITVTPYMEIDGVMKKGSTCVARRFTNDILNTLVGSTYTKIAEDPEGGEYIESTNKQDSSGNESDTIGSLDDSNILQHVKKGFGLAGSDGYIALAKQFFVGVPDSIWILIGMALAVSIAVIVFKALRGM